uniref:HDC13584 n=1 Tax=Drosophila melanogaster TaxID=7227 RepID=Q6IK19_DROME|nr:TPA_inf: HDC13584 [Drosophila melanogaster]
MQYLMIQIRQKIAPDTDTQIQIGANHKRLLLELALCISLDLWMKHSHMVTGLPASLPGLAIIGE